jgi:Putative metal-binding motif
VVSRLKQASWWLVLVAVGSAGLIAPGCSSDFSSCEAYRDCPNSGAAGVGGADAGAGVGVSGAPDVSAGAGAGGEGDRIGAAGEGGQVGDGGQAGDASSVECTIDADCSDHLACDGVESCVHGACVPGVAPCANPEPEHCDVVCVELKGAASCSVQGQDEDKDGHLSSACAANPGDDCDDNAATTYPGAPELCDHIDNNCNGKVDLSDGLTPGGTTVVIGPVGAQGSSPTIAWATDKSVYGIAYRDTSSSTSADAYFEEVDQTGAVTFAPTAFNDVTTMGGPFAAGVNLTWGGDGFGAVWLGKNGLNFRPIGSTGSLAASAVSVPLVTGYSARYTPVVARIPGGNWAVVSFEDNTSVGSLVGNTVSPAGVAGSPVILTLNPGISDTLSSSIAASGTNFVIEAADGSGAGIWSSNLSAHTQVSNGYDSVVASGQNGFAVVNSPTNSDGALRFTAFENNGTVLCGPVSFPDASFYVSGVVATPKGYLVVSLAGDLRVQEILPNCVFGQFFTVGTERSRYTAIAGSATGYGVVWQDDATNVLKRRMFGPNFCD